MGKVSETSQIPGFIARAEAQFGPRIKIRRRVDTIRKGVPDIECTLNSFSLPIEAKHSVAGLTKILKHRFTAIQVHDMTTSKEAGAFPIGLIFRNGEERFILPEDIPEDGQISLEQYLKLPIFRWEDVTSLAQNHAMRFRQ